MTVTLQMRLVSSANVREHWAVRAKRVRAQRNVARLATSSLVSKIWRGIRHLRVLRVRLVRVAPRRFDSDNLCSSLKGVRDGVADALGIDDGSDRVLWEYAQERGKPREHSVRIEIGKVKP